MRIPPRAALFFRCRSQRARCNPPASQHLVGRPAHARGRLLSADVAGAGSELYAARAATVTVLNLLVVLMGAVERVMHPRAGLIAMQ